MKSRWYFVFGLFLVACSPLEKGSSNPSDSILTFAEVIATQQYEIRQSIELVNEGDHEPSKQNLWVALIQDVPPYQDVLSMEITPAKYLLITDEYGNQYAEFDLSEHPPGTAISIEFLYAVSVNDITYDLSNCQGELPFDFTQPELHIESSNGQIVSLARDLSKGKKSVCEQVRAFYDYAGDELIYSYNRNAWGAQATFGLMGADCTEYASLMIALSRAEGIPARYYEGVLFLENSGGDEDNEIAQTKHAWLDVYLPGIGWATMDPTMGRWETNRETYFAHHVPNRIIVTTGRNPSTLRGASYWSHLYWPGNLTTIRISEAGWEINPMGE